MGTFSKHLAARGMSQESGDLVPVIDPAVVATPAPMDPLAPAEDVFEEQRQRRNSEREDGVTQVDTTQEINGTPVDGEDDKQTVGKTDSDEPVAEGEFGDKPTTTGPVDDKTIDHDDSDFEFDNLSEQSLDQELDQIQAEEQLLDQLDSQVRMLSESAIAIENFGMNPTAMAVLQTTGLLSGTALESMGLESVNFTSGQDAESQMALEAIGEKIKDTAGAWAAKVVSVVKGGTEKLLSILEKMWTSVSSTASNLASSAWDSAKATGAAIKAHPYRTAAAAVAAVAVVGGIVAMVATGTPAPGAKIDVMKKFLTDIAAKISAVKWPFGSVKSTVSDNGLKLLTNAGGAQGAFNVADTKTLKELGWTQTAVKALLEQLNRAWGGVKKGLSALGTRAIKLVSTTNELHKDFVRNPASAAGNAAGNAVFQGLKARGVGNNKAMLAGFYAKHVTEGAYKSAVYTLIGGLFKMCRTVVVGAFKLLIGTFKKIKSAVTGGESAEPAAA